MQTLIGAQQDALAHFSAIGHTCPLTYNPADYFIEILAIENKYDRERVNTICETCLTRVFRLTKSRTGFFLLKTDKNHENFI
jgi:hypothetical protein